MNEKNSLMQITRTLEKLFKAGFNTEKKVLAIKLEDLQKIENLQSNETMIIIEFKKAVKEKNIVSFLSGFKEGKN